jgi:hypothetical protein
MTIMLTFIVYLHESDDIFGIHGMFVESGARLLAILAYDLSFDVMRQEQTRLELFGRITCKNELP